MWSFKRKHQLVYMLCYISTCCFAQQTTDTTNATKKITRKHIVAAGIAVQQIASTYIEYKWWWEGNAHKFNTLNDGGFNNESNGLDKLGHAYASYVFFNAINESMKWADFSQKQRMIWSCTLPALWAISIELGDGFSTYGFSSPDLVANFSGIAYGYLQQQLPYLQHINFKFFYYPSNFYAKNNFKQWSLSEDYDGHSYWLSFDVHKMLPKQHQHKWPKWVNLAAGYSTYNFRQAARVLTGGPQQKEFLIGLEFNIGAIKTKSSTITTVKNMLNFIHIPAPGLKTTNKHNTSYHILLLH